MSDTIPLTVEIYEQDRTAKLDRDFGILSAESADFHSRTSAMMAAWQPVPPMMIFAFADRLSQWIEYFRQAQPDAEWLAGKGRPAMRERLTLIIDQLRAAVAMYQQQMAGQGVAYQQGPATTCAGSNPEAAKTMAEAEKIDNDTRAATQAARAKLTENYTRAILGR